MMNGGLDRGGVEDMTEIFNDGAAKRGGGRRTMGTELR